MATVEAVTAETDYRYSEGSHTEFSEFYVLQVLS